ncbi:TPA: hypothetical protein DDW35_02330, partial [Candidatus Sumerlaeota bacterium]|nr:hypothetical protein [Candidatus Sumerlaeota bacterium]
LYYLRCCSCRAWVKRERLMSRKPTHVCVDCGTFGRPIWVNPASILIAVILLLCFFVPGVIYILWGIVSTYQVCPKCRSRAVIPLNSPKGQEFISNTQKKQVTAEHDIPTQIAKMAELKDNGIITQQEFDSKKSELLARM